MLICGIPTMGSLLASKAFSFYILIIIFVYKAIIMFKYAIILYHSIIK